MDGTHARAVAVVPDAYSVEWHPDGQVLLVSAFAREDGTILPVDLDTGDATRIAEHATFAAWSPDGEEICHVTKEGAPQPS